MPLHEQHLKQEATSAENLHIALGITAAFKSLVSVDKPTIEELAEIDAAETAWNDASKALSDYQAVMRSR